MDPNLEFILKQARHFADTGLAEDLEKELDEAEAALVSRLRAVADRLRRAASMRDVGDGVGWAIRELDAIAGNGD